MFALLLNLTFELILEATDEFADFALNQGRDAGALDGFLNGAIQRHGIDHERH